MRTEVDTRLVVLVVPVVRKRLVGEQRQLVPVLVLVGRERELVVGIVLGRRVEDYLLVLARRRISRSRSV